MRRREVIAGAASFAVVSAAGAQQSSTVQRLAILSPSHPVAQMQENSSNAYSPPYLPNYGGAVMSKAQTWRSNGTVRSRMRSVLIR
jgi:hypothetical protein